MGYSICAALAACCVRPDEQVVVTVGDGAFQMSHNEIATLKQMECEKVLIVVLHNGKLGRVHNESWGNAGEPEGCEIILPDLVKLADAYGCTGKRIATSDLGEIQKLVAECLDTPGITIVDLVQNPDTKPKMHKSTADKAKMLEEVESPESRGIYVRAARAVHHRWRSERPGRRTSEWRLFREATEEELDKAITVRKQQGTGRIVVHGHVQDVIEGRATEALEVKVLLSDVRHGMEAGSPFGRDSIGDAVAVNGHGYCRCTDRGSDKFFQTIEGREFTSPAFAMVYPRNAVPDYLVTLERGTQVSIKGLLAGVLRAVKERCVVVGGTVQFHTCNGTAISRPTIWGENIFQHRKKYWEEEGFHFDDETGYICGFLGDFTGPDDQDWPAGLERILYVGATGDISKPTAPTNGHAKPSLQGIIKSAGGCCGGHPAESGPMMHVHACLVDHSLKELELPLIDQISPAVVGHAMHLDCGSVVSAARLEVFKVTSFEEYDRAAHGSGGDSPSKRH